MKAAGLVSKKGGTVLWPYILLCNSSSNIFFFPHLVSLIWVNEKGTSYTAESLILMPVPSLAQSASMWVILFGGRGNGLACLFPLCVHKQPTSRHTAALI